MKQLICKECGKERELGRRLCKACNSKRVCSYGRYMWIKKCEACGNEYEAWRKVQRFCKPCYKLQQELAAQTKSTNNYIFTHLPGETEHRNIAQRLLGRKLKTNEIVHHIDDDPRNNETTNLMVLSRQNHARLHQFLDAQRVIIVKAMAENHENCWNNLIAPMTTTWLETANVKVIKLWEIGQSAAEPLQTKVHEEGSETMHVTSVTDDAVEDDIVQTTTERASES